MTAVSLEDRTTWVYCLHCQHEGLLYVGVAFNLRLRLSQHKSRKHWWPEVEFVLADEYRSRAHALAVERWYIQNFHPIYNESGVREPPAAPHSFLRSSTFYVNDDGKVVRATPDWLAVGGGA